MQVTNEELKEFWKERYITIYDHLVIEGFYSFEDIHKRASQAADKALTGYCSFLEEQFTPEVFE